VSAQRVELVCFLTLLTLFGSKYFRVVHALHSNHIKTKVTRHCAPPRNYVFIAQFEEGTQLARKLHPTRIVRLADINFI
jgi:hypothetical protein